jgi:hypothetical protein
MAPLASAAHVRRQAGMRMAAPVGVVRRCGRYQRLAMPVSRYLMLARNRMLRALVTFNER